MTVNGLLAVWAVGLPVLPVGDPGAAASPGTTMRSFAKAPALTAIGALVPLFEEPDTLTVWLPAALRVAPTVNVFVP